MKEDDINFDDANFDDMDMAFDDLSMGAEEQEQNRDPVTQLKANFFKGAVTKATDVRELEEKVKDAVPEGFSSTYTEAKQGYQQIDKAKRNLVAPIQKELPEFRRNLNRLSPLVKRMMGDRFGNKFEELTNVKAKDPQVDADAVEIQSGLASIFGTWRESQLEDRRQDISDKLMDELTDEERFKVTHETNLKISNALSRQVAFNENVLLKVHEKSLELDYKKYHVLRNLLKVTTEGYNTSIGELKAITKNTGLPDIIKRQNSENFQQLFLDEWQGRTTANIVDFGKEYITRLGENLQNKATEVGQGIAEGMSALGDAAGAFADMDEMQQEMGGPQKSNAQLALETVGQAGGSAVTGKVTDFLLKRGRKYLDENPEARRVDKYLQYMNANKEQLLDSYIRDNADAGGAKGAVFSFLDSLRPTIERDRESITHTLAEKATQEAQWDRISRETLIKIIPGWLSKIHHILKIMATGDPNAEQETFDIYSESFATQRETLRRLEEQLVGQDSIETVRENVDKVVAAIFSQNQDKREALTDDQIAILENAILRSANNDIGTDLDQFSSSETYSDLDGVSKEDAEALANALSSIFNNGESGKAKYKLSEFSDRGGEANRRLAMLGAFGRLKGNNPETQSVFNLLNATGNSQLLEQLGYGKRDAEGKLNLDFTNLYNRKLGKFSGSDLFASTAPVAGVDQSELNTIAPVLEAQRRDIEEQLTQVNLDPEVFDGLTDQLTTINETLLNIESLMDYPEPEDLSAGWNEDMAELFNDDRQHVREVNLAEETLSKITEGITALITKDRRSVTKGGQNDDSFENQLIAAVGETNTILGDVHNALTEMYAAQQSNHEEMMGRDSLGNLIGNLGTKFSNFFSSPFKLIRNTFTKAKDFAMSKVDAVKRMGSKAIGAVTGFGKGVINEVKSEVLTPDDIYVKGQKEPVLRGSTLKRGKYFNRDASGKLGSKRIRSIDDIEGEVIDAETNRIAISWEEYQTGLETRNPGFAKKIGGVAVKALMAPIKLARFSYDKAMDAGKWLGGKAGAAKQFIEKKINAAKSLYDNEGNLLVTKEELESGALYVIENGKRVTVNKLEDIKDTVYRYKDGEPAITLEQVKNGLRDKSGRVVRFKGLGETVANKMVDAAKLTWKAIKSPFALLGKTTQALMKMFEGKLIKSLLVHVPDNVIFKANVVNLYAETIKRKGKGGPDIDLDDEGIPKDTPPKGPNDGSSGLGERAKAKAETVFSDINKRYEETKARVDDVIANRDELKEEVLNRTETVKEKFMEAHGGKWEKLTGAITELTEQAKENSGKNIADALKAEFDANRAKEEAMRKWEAQLKKVRGDSDGDGIRDGSWKEQLKERLNRNSKGKTEKSTKKDDKDEGSGKFLKMLMMMLGPIAGGLGKLLNMDIFSLMGKAGDALGLTRLATTVATTAAGSSAAGAATTAAGGAAAGGAAAKAKGLYQGTKAGAKKVFSKVGGKKIASAAAKFGAKRAAGAAAAGGLAAAGFAVAAPLVGVALTVWTAFEVGSAIWGYFDRRSDIKRIEYLRFLQYGYYVGEDGDYEDRKVALRYFEKEILGRMEPNSDGVVAIEGSVDELWEEYCGDFDSSYGDEAARAGWTSWFEKRFKPVFFKWISVIAELNKAGQYNLGNLDDKLTPELYPYLTGEVMKFPEVSFDPLEIMASCFTSTPVQAKRKQIQSFIDKNILKTEDKVQGKVKTPAEVEAKRKATVADAKAKFNETQKRDKVTKLSSEQVSARDKALRAMYGGKSNAAAKLPSYSPSAPKDIRRLALQHIIEADATSIERLLPMVDMAGTLISRGGSSLRRHLRNSFLHHIEVEDLGKSNTLITDWISGSFVPLMRYLVKTVGFDGGAFNDIDDVDLNTLLNNGNKNFSKQEMKSKGLYLVNGRLPAPGSTSEAKSVKSAKIIPIKPKEDDAMARAYKAMYGRNGGRFSSTNDNVVSLQSARKGKVATSEKATFTDVDDLLRKTVGDFTGSFRFNNYIDSLLQDDLNGTISLDAVPVDHLMQKFYQELAIPEKGREDWEVDLEAWIHQVLQPALIYLKGRVGIEDGKFNKLSDDDLAKLGEDMQRKFADSAYLATYKDKTLTVNNKKANLKAYHDFDASKINPVVKMDESKLGTNPTRSGDTVSEEKKSTPSIRPVRQKPQPAFSNSGAKWAGSREINYVQRNAGGSNVLGNHVQIQPLSLPASPSTSGNPAPHEVTDKIEKRIAEFNGYIHEASQKTGVDEHLIRSVIRQESAGKVKAKSHVGAGGLMQLMPATAKELGVTNRFDPRQNIMGGTEYIRRQLKRFDGIPELALAAYNAGGGNVNKAIRKAGTKDPQAVLNTLPQVTGRHSKETQQYVVKITNDYRKRLGLGGESVYSKEGNNVRLTRSMESKTPDVVKRTPTVTQVTQRTPSPPSASHAASSSIATVTNPIRPTQPTHDIAGEVIKEQQNTAARTRAIVDKQSENMTVYQDTMLRVNQGQLDELVKLNQKIGGLVEAFGQTPLEEPEEPSNVEPMVAKADTGNKRFKRRVIESKPPISMDRKIS